MVVLNESPLSDKRSFEGFMNCEPRGKPAFEEYVRVGPLPKVSSLYIFRNNPHVLLTSSADSSDQCNGCYRCFV